MTVVYQGYIFSSFIYINFFNYQENMTLSFYLLFLGRILIGIFLRHKDMMFLLTCVTIHKEYESILHSTVSSYYVLFVYFSMQVSQLYGTVSFYSHGNFDSIDPEVSNHPQRIFFFLNKLTFQRSNFLFKKKSPALEVIYKIQI